MCTPIVVEKEFVVKAVKEFKRRYPQTSTHKAALRWGAKFAREGRVIDNENGSFTIKPTQGQEYVIVNRVCGCGIAQPCAHRIAVNLAKLAIEIRQQTSEYLLDRAELRQQLAETYQPYLFDCTPTGHQLTDTRAEYVTPPTKPAKQRPTERGLVCVKCSKSNCLEHGLLGPRPFFTESDEVRAVLREQEER
jgi:hypothetical protein